MSEQQPIHVAIVGGGIGGVVLGIALSKFAHIKYTIFESRGAFGEIGAGVAFFKNGHSAMRLIDPRIWESYLEIASFNGWADKQDVWFDFRNGERGETEGRRIVEVAMNNPKGLSQVHRAGLLDALVKLLPADVTEFNKRLVSVDQSQEKAVCQFADGSRREADLVVGCDGIWSACRPLVFDNLELVSPRFTGKVAYRGLVPMKLAEQVLGDEHANNRTMFLGRGGHVLTFPVANGAMMNVVAFHETNKITWEGEAVQKLQLGKAQRDFSESQWGSCVVKIVALLQPDVWAIFEHGPVPTFHSGRICLLGDAAHAMSPHLGQGAGMAIEDSYILSNLLGDCSSREDIPAALAAYDSVRVPRAIRVAAESLENGKRLDLQGSTAGCDLDKLAAELDKVARWIWDLDLEEHLKTAAERFKEIRKS